MESIKGTFKIIITYLFQDIKKKPRSFKIGILTIFIVVGFLTLLQSALQLTPLIFLKISEDQVGDADIIFSPISAANSTSGSSSTIPIRLLNGTKMENYCEKVEGISGCSPRWIFFGDVKKFKGNNQTVRCYLLVIDSVKERSAGLGRNLHVNNLGKNESYLTSSTIQSLGIELEKGYLFNLLKFHLFFLI